MEEISIKEILSILKRRKWLIIILFVVSIIASGLITYFVLDKKYEASTTLMIGTKDGIEYNEILLNQKLVSTYGELIKIRAVADEVIKNLGLTISYKQYKSKVNVDFVEDTGLIKIIVNDSDPQVAADIANEVAKVFIKTVKDLMKVENIQVIDKAQVDTEPISPKPILNITIAGILGLMLGMFISFFKEYIDNSIKTCEDVEKYLGLFVLVTIPKADKLFKSNNSKWYFSESFKALRTNIRFTSIKELKMIVVTSTGDGEGKTTVASNLAVSIAQAGKRVLLMDCNMRKPSIHEVFDIPNEEGLTNILSGERNMEDVVHNWQEDLNLLSVITSGVIPPNPAEILESDKMLNLLEDIRNKFDMVVIDTPSINLFTDGVILSALADGTIMVVEVRKTDKDLAKKGKKLLEEVHANLIGVVLNKMPNK